MQLLVDNYGVSPTTALKVICHYEYKIMATYHYRILIQNGMQPIHLAGNESIIDLLITKYHVDPHVKVRCNYTGGPSPFLYLLHAGF